MKMDRRERKRFRGLLDMIDGGGAGRSGDEFEGGLLSEVLNAMGVRPFGYDERQERMARMRPVMATTAPTYQPQPAVAPMPTQPATQDYGMTPMPLLTADQIRLLQELGIDVGGMEGEPASHSEIAALLRAPGALLSMDNPQVGRMYAPPNPGATIQPDGSSMPRYDVPTTSGVSIGQSDIGTVRPFASRVPTRMPMPDFQPVMNILPPPVPIGMNLPVNPDAAEANRAYIEMLLRAAASGNPIRPAASMLPR
jgi:hypothetical protein